MEYGAVRTNMTHKVTSKRFSVDEVKAKVANGRSRSRADAPEAEDLPEAFWADAVRVKRRPGASQ